MTFDNVQNKKPLFTLQKIIAEYVECTPTGYEIKNEINDPHPILSLD